VTVTNNAGGTQFNLSAVGNLTVTSNVSTSGTASVVLQHGGLMNLDGSVLALGGFTQSGGNVVVDSRCLDGINYVDDAKASRPGQDVRSH
jgi:hypothetical protein